MQLNKHGILTRGRAPHSLPFFTPPTLVPRPFFQRFSVFIQSQVTISFLFATGEQVMVTIIWIHGCHCMDTRVNLRRSLLTNTIFFLSSLLGNSVSRNNAVAPLVDGRLPQVVSKNPVASLWIGEVWTHFSRCPEASGRTPHVPTAMHLHSSCFHHLTVRLSVSIAPFSL